ncbi:MAG TPA: FAD-linked oxidase C-terminal domain-containing protein [Acidothermaceae bacterium]|nr:FAD-linked oxidase C-terminal domain-containing protein [Acidothermaceae bacterium]
MIEELGAELPSGRLLTDADVVEAYRRDEARLVDPGHPLGVVLARDVADVQTTLRWATRHRVPVVARGAGTGLSGGASAIDGCIVLSLAKMDAIVELNAGDQLAVVEPGVINGDLQKAAAEHGLMFAPDPASFEISTIGGNVATNAGGLRCVKYGVTREAVLGLEVVLADGRVLNTGRRTVKGVAGYDLTALFVGSEGTLGIVTRATLRLRPRPSTDPVTIVGVFATLTSAGDAVNDVMGAGLQPSLLELMDNATIRAVDDWKHVGLDRAAAAMLIAQVDVDHPREPALEIEKAFAAAGATYTAVSTDATESAELLGIRRMTHWALERLGMILTEDVGVPRSKLAQMLGRIEEIGAHYDVVIATVGHAGDGNLHPSVVVDSERAWPAAEAIYTAALELGGTITGEHGVGSLKRDWLPAEIGEVGMELQRALKATFDPFGILNPGKAI